MTSNREAAAVARCECCGAVELEQISLPFAQFRHPDYETVRQCGTRMLCPQCGTMMNGEPKAVLQSLDAFIESPSYANSRQTDHKVLADDLNQRVTRSFLQAKLIADNLKFDAASRLRILDIGCFDGKLLVELKHRFPHAQLNGFDVNPHLVSQFPQQPSFHLHQSNLEDVPGGFDLITISHCFAYLSNLSGVMKQLHRLIDPEGVIYVQAPDFDHNPCHTLLGDQYRYFRAANLRECFRRKGFRTRSLTNSSFSRETIVLASPQKSSSKQLIPSAQTEKPSFVAQLFELAANVQAIDHRQLIVLGTTVNAAFVDSLLGTRLTSFVDENENLDGSAFRGKPVHRPESIKADEVVVLPYGVTAHRIAQRMSEQYNGRFVCV